MAWSVPEQRPRGAGGSPLITDAVWKRIGGALRALVEEDGQPQPDTERHALGILFIHGMGEQARGDTITEMGDATTEWLRRWLGNDRFRIQKATLRSREGATAEMPSDSSGRANATIILGRSGDPEGSGQRWLLAESWWADAFRPATFIELTWWAMGVGPWLISSQLAGLGERLRSPGGGVAAWLIDRLVFSLLFLLAAVVAALIAPLAFLLLLLSMVPIPFVGPLAQAIARNLAGSFGDLLVFVRSPIRFAAMAERVRSDIEWLGSQCDRVIIVAHSQGTAVAWQAIRRTAQAQRGRRAHERTPLATFVTFGQAFRKLKALHRLHTRVGRDRQREFTIFAIASTLSLLGAGLAAYTAFGVLVDAEGDVSELLQRAWWVLVAFIGMVGVVALVQWRLATMAAANDAKAQNLILADLADVKGELRNFRWLDLWASADPAPNGELFSAPAPGVQSYRVRNLGSTFLDHSTYWSNLTEFVSAVVFAAGSLVGAPTGPKAIPPRLRRAAAIRNLRVTGLAAGRVIVVAAFLAAVIGFREVLPTIGGTVVSLLLWLPFVPSELAGWPGAVRGAAGTVVIAALAGLAWWLWKVGWVAVIRGDERRFFARQDEIEWPLPATAWALSVALAPTLLMVGLSLWRWDATFVLVYVGLGVAGLLVVARLMRTSEPRFSN